MPHHKEAYYSLITHQYKDITAVLELGDMFYGGGVPIDHYIIQVEDGTVLETPGPTYSFDIMYNTSLSVNISAYNCAGYSDPFHLYYSMIKVRVYPPVLISQNLDNMENNMSDETDFMEKNMTSVTPTYELDNGLTTLLLATLTVTVVIILTILSIILLLVISCFVCKTQ